jgi:Na+-translocating ferredoxin:NAD+ oxidoreductase RnfD subunit
MSRVRVSLAAALAVAEIADIMSTYAAQAAGGREANPIMAAMMAAAGPQLWWVPKMAIAGVVCALMVKSRRWAIAIACVVVAALPPLANILQLALK